MTSKLHPLTSMLTIVTATSLALAALRLAEGDRLASSTEAPVVDGSASTDPVIAEPEPNDTPEVIADPAGPPPPSDYSLFDLARDQPRNEPALPGLTQIETDALAWFREICGVDRTERTNVQLAEFGGWLASEHPELMSEADRTCVAAVAE